MQSALAARRRSVHGAATQRSPLQRVLTQLQRLTAESGLWANAGGRFSDLSDAHEWMAKSPRMRARRSQPTTTAQLATIRVATAGPTLTDRVVALADAVVAWTLAPLFRCCEGIEKLHDIPIGTVFMDAVVQFMLQIFILLADTTARVRARAVPAP